MERHARSTRRVAHRAQLWLGSVLRFCETALLSSVDVLGCGDCTLEEPQRSSTRFCLRRTRVGPGDPQGLTAWCGGGPSSARAARPVAAKMAAPPARLTLAPSVGRATPYTSGPSA